MTQCMHCGLCLPTCPTYVLTGSEKSSPRGRIRLMRAVAKGELGITKGFVEEMDFCLDCQACESACPAGVKYGSLVESARNQIAHAKYKPWSTRLLNGLLLKCLFQPCGTFAIAARLLYLYQASGLDWFIRKTGALGLLSRRLYRIQDLTPRIAKRASSKTLMTFRESPGQKGIRAGFLTGCIMDVAFADVNLDTIKLLEHHGCNVIAPHEQVCCGSLQAHNGDLETARRLARQNVKVFSRLNLDVLVMNSAGCGAFMKEYGEVLKDEPEYAAPAAEISAKVKDISELLCEIGLKVSNSSPTPFKSKRVTYHDACHLVHSQKISEQPRKLIRSVPLGEYVELPESTWCCGSAGTYNITHYDTAMQLLDRKTENIRRVQPDIVVTGNPGCLIQLEFGLRKEGLQIELLHLATFLRRACCD